MKAGALIKFVLLLTFVPGGVWGQISSSWALVHASVGAQLVANSLDIKTSWKQPEKTQWLREQTGEFEGRFYRTGLRNKIGTSVVLSLASYGLSAKWPRSRKYVVLANFCFAGVWFGTAIYNYRTNPYFRRGR